MIIIRLLYFSHIKWPLEHLITYYMLLYYYFHNGINFVGEDRSGNEDLRSPDRGPGARYMAENQNKAKKFCRKMENFILESLVFLIDCQLSFAVFGGQRYRVSLKHAQWTCTMKSTSGFKTCFQTLDFLQTFSQTWSWIFFDKNKHSDHMEKCLFSPD